MIRLLTISLSLFSILASADPRWVGGGREVPETDDAYRAVVFVRAQTWGCTGTFLNETTLLTANHCVGHDKDGAYVTVQGIRSLRVFENPDYVRLKAMVEPSGPYDVVLAVFPEKTGEKLGIHEFKRLADRPPRAREKVTMVGYGINDIAHKSGGGVKRWGENEVEISGRMIVFTGLSVPGTQTGKEAAGAAGDSGGPLFNERGEIVGVTSYGTQDKFSRYHRIYYANVLNPANLRLYRKAVHCEGSPCASDFEGSGAARPPHPLEGKCLEDDESREWVALLVEQTRGYLSSAEAKRLAELTRRRNRYGRCDGN